MKKILLVLFLCLFSYSAAAEDPYITEVRALGIIAGQGLACNASKYENYEMLARSILVTKAMNDAEQAMAMKIYNEEKANTYISKKMDGFFECKQIARSFDNQEIFNMRLYSDGTIQMPDGKIFTPRTPYDATLVYDKKHDDKGIADKIYDSVSDKPVKITIRDERIGGEGTTVNYIPPVKTGQAPVINAPSANNKAPQKNNTPKSVDDGSIRRITRTR